VSVFQTLNDLDQRLWTLMILCLISVLNYFTIIDTIVRHVESLTVTTNQFVLKNNTLEVGSAHTIDIQRHTLYINDPGTGQVRAIFGLKRPLS